MKLREITNATICKNNKLESPIYTNVTEEALTKQKIKSTLNILAKIEAGTVGPYGATTIIANPNMAHLITKDGYDLLNRLKFTDEVAATILETLLKISEAQVNVVGDGSTSTILVANALYSILTSNVTEEIQNDEKFKKLLNIPPKDILNLLNILSSELEKRILDSAKPISEDLHELELIATISNNNDKTTGKLVHDIYKRIGDYGYVETSTSRSLPSDIVEYVDSISWKRGYIDKTFAVNNPTGIVKHTNPYIFLTNAPLTFDHIEPLILPIIGHVCGKLKRELVVVCNGVDEDVKNFAKYNRTKHMKHNGGPEMKFTFIDIDQVTSENQNKLKSLALCSGAKIFEPHTAAHDETFIDKRNIESIMNVLGSVIEITTHEYETNVIYDDKLLTEEQLTAKNERIEYLKKEIDELELLENGDYRTDRRKHNFKLELRSLTSISGILHVAGKTETERISRERLLEDSIRACKSAIRNGYITGGNLIIPRIIYKEKDELVDILFNSIDYLHRILRVEKDEVKEYLYLFLDKISEAFEESFMHVLNNATYTEEEIQEIIKKCIREDVFYNLKLHQYESLDETQIVNPTDTDIQIMKNCFSIIGVLSTSNQFVTNSFNMSNTAK